MIDIEQDSRAAEFFPVVLKVTAVSLICEMCSHLLEAAEEIALSKVLLAAGKIEIIVLSLPLFKALYDSARSFVS